MIMAGGGPDGIGAAMLGVPVSAGAAVWVGTAGAGTAIIITGRLFTGPPGISLRVTGLLVISPLVTGPPVTGLLVTSPRATIGREVDVRVAVMAAAAVAEAGLIPGLRNSLANFRSNEGAVRTLSAAAIRDSPRAAAFKPCTCAAPVPP